MFFLRSDSRKIHLNSLNISNLVDDSPPVLKASDPDVPVRFGWKNRNRDQKFQRSNSLISQSTFQIASVVSLPHTVSIIHRCKLNSQIRPTVSSNSADTSD